MRSFRTLQSLPVEQRPGTPQRLRLLYQRHIVQEGKEERFLIFTSFLATFSAVRFITHSIRAHRFTRIFHNFSAGGGKTHLHHLVFGIVGLLVTGQIATGFDPPRRGPRDAVAALFGASAALTMDEFALWLNLQDVYWAKQGRESIDAAVLTTAASFLAFDGRNLFRAMAHDVKRLLRATTGELEREVER